MGKRILRKASRWIYNRLKYGETLSVQIDGLTWVLPVRDIYFTQSLVIEGGHESFETTVFFEWLREGMTVVDIGAHVGWYTLLAARRVGPGGRVFAFEPDPVNYKFLVSNVVANGFRNVDTIPKAVADRCGDMRLILAKENLGGHRLSLDSADQEAVLVKTTTLDAFFETLSQPPQVIKMDIEGAEGLAWRGMQGLLRRQRDLRIMMEFAPEVLARLGSSPQMLFDEFLKAGFVPYRIDEERRQLISTDLVDLLRVCELRHHHYSHVFLARQ